VGEEKGTMRTSKQSGKEGDEGCDVINLAYTSWGSRSSVAVTWSRRVRNGRERALRERRHQ